MSLSGLASDSLILVVRATRDAGVMSTDACSRIKYPYQECAHFPEKGLTHIIEWTAQK